MLGKTVGDCLQCIKKSILLTNKTSGHGVGNTGDYTDIGWDNDGNTRSTWGN